MPALVAEDALHLIGREEIVRTLVPAAVGILPAEEAAVRSLELAQAVVKRVLGHGAPERHVSILPRLGICECQQGVVIERLFKMRRKPLAVSGVAGKAAADMVIDAALVHLPQRVLDHLPRLFLILQLCILHQENEVMRGRELRRCAEAAVLLVVGFLKLRLRRLCERGKLHCCRRCGLLPQPRGELPGGLRQLFSAAAPLIRDGQQQLTQSHAPAAALARKICSDKKRLLLRRHYNGQRPAAAAVERGADLHIHAVDIRPLLAVDLDRDIIMV